MNICRPPTRRRAFTLIELLICTAILAILMPVTFGVLNHLGALQARLQGRADAIDDATRAIALWRADVTLSRKVQASSDSSAIQIDRLDSEGRTISVRYEQTPDSQLIRMIVPAPDGDASARKVLARHVEGVTFAPQGRGWRMTWNSVIDDAAAGYRLEHGALATPLNAASGEVGR